MLKKVSENILDVLKIMKTLEEVMAALYLTCSRMSSFDKEFWTDMGQAETKHARHIDRLMETVSKRPEAFELNPHFRSAAIKTAISGVQWQMDRLRRHQITEEKMLYIARDLEQAVLESQYHKVIATSDPEFKSLMDLIVSDTVSHQDQLKRKISSLTASRSKNTGVATSSAT